MRQGIVRFGAGQGTEAQVGAKPTVSDDVALRHAVARHVLFGLLESLTFAGRLDRSAEAVNATLLRLLTDRGGRTALTQPYAGRVRFVVAVVARTGGAPYTLGVASANRCGS